MVEMDVPSPRISERLLEYSGSGIEFEPIDAELIEFKIVLPADPRAEEVMV